MLLSEQGIDLDGWKEALDASPTPADLDKFVEHLHVDYLPHTVIIDCTADDSVAKHYADWLERGHPRRHAEQEGQQRRRWTTTSRCTKRAGSAARSYLYEATVGAGLPVIQTLRDLRETGDEITSIEGIFSGTLAYLFNVYDGKTPFSEIVKDAKARATPSPIRATTSPARTSRASSSSSAARWACKLEMSDVQVESLVPAGLEKGTIDDFLNGLPKYDGAMQKRFDAARVARQGAALRGPPHRGRQGHGRRCRARQVACVREHRAHRQRRALRDARATTTTRSSCRARARVPKSRRAACSPTCCACRSYLGARL